MIISFIISVSISPPLSAGSKANIVPLLTLATLVDLFNRLNIKNPNTKKLPSTKPQMTTQPPQPKPKSPLKNKMIKPLKTNTPINLPAFKAQTNSLKDIYNKTRQSSSGPKILVDSPGSSIFWCSAFTWCKKSKRWPFKKPILSTRLGFLKIWTDFAMARCHFDSTTVHKIHSFSKFLNTPKQWTKWSRFTSMARRAHWQSESFRLRTRLKGTAGLFGCLSTTLKTTLRTADCLWSSRFCWSLWREIKSKISRRMKTTVFLWCFHCQLRTLDCPKSR